MEKRLKQIAYLKLLRISEKSKFCDQLEKGPCRSLFHERLVFSFLGYSDRIGRPVSKRQIAEGTGLSPRTVEKTLSTLGSMVIINKQGKWSPVTPDTDWFGLLPDPDGDHWYDTLQYVKLYLPRRGAKIRYEKSVKRFGLNHAAVYSQLISLAGRSSTVFTTETGLSSLLNGINRKTIATVLNDLDHVGLINREIVGNHLRVQLLSLTDEHLLLFRPIPKGEKIAVKQPKHPADPNKYEFKGDNYDQWRKLCQGLMAQSYAEKAIEISVELMESFDCFQEFLIDTKKWHESNRKKGKVTKGNLGGFLVSRYKGKLNKRKEDEAEEKKIQELHDYWDSDKYQAKVEAEEKVAAADPLHKKHFFGVESITSRVCFNPDNAQKNHQEAQRLIDDFQRHIKHQILIMGNDLNESAARNLRLESSNIATKYLRYAITPFNDHYNSDSRATENDFIGTINKILNKFELDEFIWVSKMENANEQPSNKS
ncbi:hypothetical protein FYZ48_11055 [Gimesia chilikensis]|uniref:hypothetical protein n=1 Tax=Gimesia chilikensis TaxID=2605989 RepID=UPI0011EDD54A|nr:hypothetical protein [Gimesia chilikensis]KAA0139171.1 hypothetical protein FYZ48_11055 [Gimesia chilikensis]